MTGTPTVSRSTAVRWLPTPEPGISPVSDSWTIYPELYAGIDGNKISRVNAGGPQNAGTQRGHGAEAGKLLGLCGEQVPGDKNAIRCQRTYGVRRHGPVSKAHHQHRTAVRGQLLDLLTNGPHRPVEKLIPPLPEGGEVKGAVAARRLSQCGLPLPVQNIHLCDRISLCFLLRGPYACQPGGFSGGFPP